ncbi:MAG: hypothetical protein QE271_13040 [Bacteriovoracaceae bacterium]|nr:hypothetical protein [Bacteriovoracaceae bacterium]
MQVLRSFLSRVLLVTGLVIPGFTFANECHEVTSVTSKSFSTKISSESPICGLLESTVDGIKYEVSYVDENGKEYDISVTKDKKVKLNCDSDRLRHIVRVADFINDSNLIVNNELFEEAAYALKFSSKNGRPFNEILFCPNKNESNEYFVFLPR